MMNRIASAYSRKDVDAIISLITPDYIGFGFGQEGKVIGEKLYRASLEREFAQCESLKLQYTWMAISSEGPVAWVASECTLTAIAGGKIHTYPGRMTTILKREGEEWRLALNHFSVPGSDQVTGEPDAGPRT
jgi:ketosteroid isomerase-like protein